MSNEANAPNAPLGSPERAAYWRTYWNQWGDSNETHRELAGLIQDLEEDFATLQNQEERFMYYFSTTKDPIWQQKAETMQHEAEQIKLQIAQYQTQFASALALSASVNAAATPDTTTTPATS